jgi:hypothetical protein
MSEPGSARITFTAAEWRAFALHAVVVAGIAAGMWMVAPSREGQLAGVIFALALLPVPLVVIYCMRRWKR